MEKLAEILERHGSIVVFATMFLDQIGLPLPGVPILLGIGALAGAGKINLGVAVGLSVLAAMLADLVWYYLGRYRGSRILALLCRVSLEPDSCVRQTENFFTRYGVEALLVTKFIPGLTTVAAPLAGMIRVSVPQFLFYGGTGTLLWVGAFAGAGYLFSDRIVSIAEYAAQVGASSAVILVCLAAGYVAWKYFRRVRFVRSLRLARITVDELKQRLDAEERLVLVDVRHPVALSILPFRIPGSLVMTFEEIGTRHHEIPRDRDIVLYCS